MATKVTIVLRKKPNLAGLYPLAVRVTINRYPIYRQFGVNLKLKDWDDSKKQVKNSHPEADELNETILEKLLETRKEFRTNNYDSVSISQKKALRRANNYFVIAQEFLCDLEANEKFGRFSTESGYLNYIKRFYKAKVLPFEYIDENFLKRFKTHLKNKHGLKEVSALNVLVQIRMFYNIAIEKGIVKKKHYPFGRGKVKIKFPETHKVGLNKWEIMLLVELKDLSCGQIHARNIWMYSFNFAGMRIADILKTRWSDFHDGRLSYRMGKNAKLVSLKVPSKALEILEHYKAEKRYAYDFVFPELKKANIEDPKDVHTKIKTATKKLNYHLKKMVKKAGIEKPLTMHIARHSFGHIAGDTIHPLKLQKLYRHSDLKTTLNYQANFIHAEVDEALDSILNF